MEKLPALPAGPVIESASNLPVKLRVDPLKVKFASPFKLVPLPPVITLSFELLDIVADPVAP